MTDNASNNFTMAKELQKLLAEQNIKWDSKTNHIPCLTHIINLVVQKFLSSLVTDGVDGSSFRFFLDKIRGIAKSIRGSHLRWEAFQ